MDWMRALRVVVRVSRGLALLDLRLGGIVRAGWVKRAMTERAMTNGATRERAMVDEAKRERDSRF